MIKNELKCRTFYLLAVISVTMLFLAYQVRRPFEIAIGERGAEPYLRNFYDVEQVDGSSYRWSSERSAIFLPGIGGYAPALLRVGLNGYRPAGLPLPTVSVRVNGRELTSFVATDQFETYEFAIDRGTMGISGSLEVEIDSEFFVPAKVMGGGDLRKLGVLVDSVSVEFQPSLVPVVIPPAHQLLCQVLAVMASFVLARQLRLPRATSFVMGALVLISLLLSVIEYRLVLGRYSLWLVGLLALANAVVVFARWLKGLASRPARLSATQMADLRRLLMLGLIFVTVLVTHWRSRICCFAGDSVWSIPTAMSIVREGNTDLDEYEEIVVRNDHYGEMVVRNDNHYTLESIGGHAYTKQPVGVSLVAVPLLFVMDKVSGSLLSLDLDEYVRYAGSGELERFVASFIVALTAVFVYLIAGLFMNRKYSLLLVVVFAFCTSSWSTASRALWQHGPSVLMLTITLYLILLAKNRAWLVQFASIPLAFSYVVRPTNSISILLLTVFVLIQYRQYFLRYLCWAMTIAIPFLLFNLSVYHSLLSTYYLPQKVASNPHLLEALAGNLISPGRGLFVFSPVLLFSICGIALRIKNRKLDKLDCILIAILFLHWVTISSFAKWWAGHSFGARFFSDTIPYFTYFLIPVVAIIPRLKGMTKGLLASIVVCSVVISFLIHYRGATDWDVHVWNEDPVGVDDNPARVWDWCDIQFLRGIVIVPRHDGAAKDPAAWLSEVTSLKTAFSGLAKRPVIMRKPLLLSSRRVLALGATRTSA